MGLGVHQRFLSSFPKGVTGLYHCANTNTNPPTHKSSITGKAKWVFQPEFITFFCYRQVLNHARYFTFRIIRLCINMYCKNPLVLDPLRKFIVLRSNRMIG